MTCLQQAKILDELCRCKITIKQDTLPPLLIKNVDHCRVLHGTLAHHRSTGRNARHIIRRPNWRQLPARSQYIMPVLVSQELMHLRKGRGTGRCISAGINTNRQDRHPLG